MLLQAVPVSDTQLTDLLDSLAHQAGLVAATVYGLQFLKRTKIFPWLNANTETANRYVSTAAAMLSALFVQAHFTSIGDAATGWHGTWSIPSLHVIYDSAVRMLGQKVGQEVFFQKFVKKPQEVAVVPPENFDVDGKPGAAA